MVDCRNCKHSYKIWRDPYDPEETDVLQIVCLAKEVFIDKECITDGPCDSYDDVDGYNPRE